jgi:type II secretory pathway component PulF
MFLSPRIGLKELAQVCRRMATALEAGIEVRRIWEREASGRSAPALRQRMHEISEKLGRGSSVSDAVADTGKYFPTLFRELVHVGEETGKLSDVLRHLAEHYEHQLKLRRVFRAAIAWPMIQLAAAVTIIGLLIWVMGFLPPMEGGKPIDILGFGLVGNKGLLIYLLLVACAAAACAAVVSALKRGVAWTRPIQRALVKLPGVGGPVQTLALARLAWSLHLTGETGMSLLRALPLSLRSTHNAHYTDHTDGILRSVRAGNEISEALAETGAFPRDFLDTLEVGEQSGRLPETMAHLSAQYQEQAQRALGVLTVLLGFAVWGVVALILILLILRVAMFYVNIITNAASGNF